MGNTVRVREIKGMTKHPARYSVSFGLIGCYLSDSQGGVYECSTMRELASIIRDELEAYGMPKSLFRDVHIRWLWAFIKRNGSSSAHFRLDDGKGSALFFHGLTREEYGYGHGNDGLCPVPTSPRCESVY